MKEEKKHPNNDPPFEKGTKMGGRVRPPISNSPHRQTKKAHKKRVKAKRKFMTFPTNEDYVDNCLKKP